MRNAVGTQFNQIERWRNPDGAWGYYPGKASRLEPTCWALLAGRRRDAIVDVASLINWHRKDGWLVDVARAPVNYAFNALAAIVLQTRREGHVEARRIATALLQVRGLTFPQGQEMRQDNSLQAWPWIDATFSWVEPTSLCLLLAKKLRRDLPAAIVDDRINIAERMLLDRACSAGGWNYGGSNVYGQELFPYVPTTALGLIAMQDRVGDATVQRALGWMRKAALSERSAHSMSLAAIALALFGQPLPALTQALTEHAKTIGPDAGVVGLAASLYALTGPSHGEDAFRI